jgi:hypothetical protein
MEQKISTKKHKKNNCFFMVIGYIPNNFIFCLFVMSVESQKKDWLKIPEATDDLETYKQYAKDNMVSVFQLDDFLKQIPLA